MLEALGQVEDEALRVRLAVWAHGAMSASKPRAVAARVRAAGRGSRAPVTREAIVEELGVALALLDARGATAVDLAAVLRDLAASVGRLVDQEHDR